MEIMDEDEYLKKMTGYLSSSGRYRIVNKDLGKRIMREVIKAIEIS